MIEKSALYCTHRERICERLYLDALNLTFIGDANAGGTDPPAFVIVCQTRESESKSYREN